MFFIISCSDGKQYSKRVIGLCRNESKIECNPDCLDGSGATFYYDSRQYKFDGWIGTSVTEEHKKASFGIHSSSVCGDCYNRFELKEDNKLKSVTCEEFFQAVEDYDKLCNNCVATMESGCC